MPTDPPPANAADSSRAWDAVTECLEAFAAAWEAGGVPPQVGDFLPADPPSVRRLVLIELVKYDIDVRLRRGPSRPLEDYVGSYPELDSDGPPCDLLYEDYHLRRQAGQGVDPGEYFRRFPGRAAELARLLGGTSPARSTAMYVAQVPLDVSPGESLDDFDLLALLGEGQFAKVFLARQRTMQRLVALKVSAHRGAEAQTLAQLDHPNIVRVYDQRLVPERNLLLVYMPYLAGGTLSDVLGRVRSSPPGWGGRTLLEAVDAALERRGELPPSNSTARERWAARSWPAAVCALGAKLAAALDCAHRLGVLHRDVKPANVLLSAEGEPMLADFNVGSCSKLDGAGPSALFGGSLGYMAVEHLEAFDPEHPREAESLDGRADVFGLAVTLWELATGQRPFGPEDLRGNWTETLAALAAQRRAGPRPEVVAGFREGDVPGLRDVLLRCLDPDPERRPATAGEMARELELCLRPATRALVRPAPGGWRGLVKRHSLLTMWPIGLAPNGIASAFNIYYNRSEIIGHRWSEAQEPFDAILLTINAIFFPLGMLGFALVLRPVGRAVRRMWEGEAVGPTELARHRRKALLLGEFGAWVCVVCWLVAGLLFPIVLRYNAGPPPQGGGVYVHFMLSLAVCGLIAGSYPYFLITFLSVRVLYPALLGPEGPAPSDGPALRRVERKLGLYRAAATAVPFVAVPLLAVLGLTNAMSARAVAVLCITGLAGTLLAYALEGWTRRDLAALADVPGTTASR